jgi:hypothetical protein
MVQDYEMRSATGKPELNVFEQNWIYGEPFDWMLGKRLPQPVSSSSDANRSHVLQQTPHFAEVEVNVPVHQVSQSIQHTVFKDIIRDQNAIIKKVE